MCCCLEIPSVVWSQLISATRIFLLASYLIVQHSEQYINTEITIDSDTCSLVFSVSLWLFWMFTSLLNTAQVCPVLLLMSTSHRPSGEICPPRYTNSLTCSNLLPLTIICRSCCTLLIIITLVLLLLMTSPSLFPCWLTQSIIFSSQSVVSDIKLLSSANQDCWPVFCLVVVLPPLSPRSISSLPPVPDWIGTALPHSNCCPDPLCQFTIWSHSCFRLFIYAVEKPDKLLQYSVHCGFSCI